MAYLDDHPPARDQFREPRREVISGVVGVHSTEGVMDDVGTDTGAENVSGFISRRTDAGSYHEPVDSDSYVSLVRDECEAYSIAVDGHNRHTWNVSFACRTVDLHPESAWTLLAMAIAGQRVRAFWDRNGFCPTCSARWLTPSQVAALRSRHETCPHGRWAGGLVCHGTLQPADRTDAWARHPHRVALEQLLVAAITDPLEEGLTVADLNTILAKLDKPRGAVGRDPRDGAVYYFEAGWKHHLATVDEVAWACWASPWVGDLAPVVVDTASTANPDRSGGEVTGLTADEIAKAVNDDAARRLQG